MSSSGALFFLTGDAVTTLTNCTMISQGMEVNMATPNAAARDGYVLDYCRLHGITIQPWSPFQYGMFEGVFLGSEKFPALNAAIDSIAAKYGVTPVTVTVAWLLRHPARCQPIMNLSFFISNGRPSCS